VTGPALNVAADSNHETNPFPVIQPYQLQLKTTPRPEI
jgi:hypothetical protein